MKKINEIWDFLNELVLLIDQPGLQRERYPTVHLTVNNAALPCHPSTLVLEVESLPVLTLIVTNLPAEAVNRGLMVGRKLWPMGDRAKAKLHILARLDETLLRVFGLDLSRPLRRPFCAVGTQPISVTSRSNSAPTTLESRPTTRAQHLIIRLLAKPALTE